MSLGTLLDRVAFAVFDVETTGLSPCYGHRVCEVACLRIESGSVVGEFESLVDPGRSVSPGAFRVNGISAEMLRGAPAFAQIAPPLLDLMNGAVLGAHNAQFDLGFLAAELDIAKYAPPRGPVLDTLTLVRKMYSLSHNSLDRVAVALGIEAEPTHRAMGDTWTTALLLERILADAAQRWGVCSLEGLLAFQGGSVPYPSAPALPLPPTIAEALAAGGLVQMRYVDRQGRETQRTVRPLRVDGSRGILYLVAHCYRAGELRTFRMDRVVDMVLVEASPSQQPADPDAGG